MILFGNKSVVRLLPLIKELWRNGNKQFSDSLLEIKQKTYAVQTKRVFFFKVISTKSLVLKSVMCWKKKSKDRLIVVMCGSIAEEIRKPLVIGKSQKPWCFKNIFSLPVMRKFNQKSRMKTEIMEQWLRYCNADMRSQDINILIFLNNAAFHPKIELSNMKILILTLKTTSIIQTMDQGVIYTFKSNYRKFWVPSLLCKTDNCSSVHQFRCSQLDGLDL